MLGTNLKSTVITFFFILSINIDYFIYIIVEFEQYWYDKLSGKSDEDEKFIKQAGKKCYII